MNDEEKWKFLADVPGRDAQHPRIKDLANHLMNAANGVPARFAQLAMTVARDWIHQVQGLNAKEEDDQC